ncbi:hypothetical protein NPIL_429301 [Nephila pilipes]|uniref:Uncharacterized protein n=1 Tax=Nephila pilipes TaxID=299642 RepID=A0A8X6Q8R5_NEPPI|nr:hypothetical protein NPIL_429301 [Nephila pilipes]
MENKAFALIKRTPKIPLMSHLSDSLDPFRDVASSSSPSLVAPLNMLWDVWDVIYFCYSSMRGGRRSTHSKNLNSQKTLKNIYCTLSKHVLNYVKNRLGFLTNGALAGIGNRAKNKSKTADSEDTRHSKSNFPRVRDLIHGQERKGSEQEGPFPDARVFRTPGEGELGNASRVSITVTYGASDGWQSLPFHSLVFRRCEKKRYAMFLNKM